MPTVTGQNIVDSARFVLQDSGTRWTDPEWLLWVNAVVRDVVNVRPDAAAVTADITLVAGTKQTLPTGGVALLDVMRNTSGKAVRKTSMSLLDAQLPNWHSATAGPTVNYTYDPRTPHVFYVYPPAVNGASVEAKYQVAATVLTSLAQTLPIDDVYANAVLEGALYRARTKDAEFNPAAATMAALHKAAFDAMLGGKTQSDAAVLPKEAAEA